MYLGTAAGIQFEYHLNRHIALGSAASALVVNLRHCHVLVTQQILNFSYIHAGVQQQGRGAVRTTLFFNRSG